MPTEDLILINALVHRMTIVEFVLVRLYFVQVPEFRGGPRASFPGSFEDSGIGIVDLVHDSVSLIVIAVSTKVDGFRDHCNSTHFLEYATDLPKPIPS